MESNATEEIETGKDFVFLLVRRGMHFIIHDILSYLDEISLRSCELVSKTWYAVITESKLWEQLFRKALVNKSVFQAIIFHKQFSHVETSKNIESYPFKKLLFSYKNLRANWRLVKFVVRGSYLPSCMISKCAMDSKRIILAGSADSIQVFNRWTLKLECIIPLENMGVKKFQLYGEFIFFSCYGRSIGVWDCKTNQIVQQFQEQGKVWDINMHVAHGLLINCFNVTPIDNHERGRFDRDNWMRPLVSQLKVTIRRICITPNFELTDERTELISHSDLHCVGVKSDANYFALILASSDHLKIQIRSTDNFQLVRYLDFPHCSPNALCDYHSGRFVTISSEGKNEKIQLWDAETLSCQTSWLVQKWTVQVMLSSLHLIMRTSSSRKNTMTAWELPQLTAQQPETKPKKLFEVGERNEMFLGFDELQIVTTSQGRGFPIKIREFLMKNE